MREVKLLLPKNIVFQHFELLHTNVSWFDKFPHSLTFIINMVDGIIEDGGKIVKSIINVEAGIF